MTDHIEEILKMSLANKNDIFINTSDCLDEETIADYSEGRLPSHEVESVEKHLAACSSCRHCAILTMKVSKAGDGDTAKEISELSEKTAKDLTENVKAQLEEELSRFEEELGLKPLASSPQECPCIMIVDDDSHYLSSLTDTLSQEFSVIPCKSGEEAITQISSRVCTIVLDIRMPVMSGIELARYFRKQSVEMPIIFNTAYPGDYPQPQILNEFRSARYVTKDNPQQLLSYLQEVSASA